MKEKAGGQVFEGNIDDILSEKIIKHTETNSQENIVDDVKKRNRNPNKSGQIRIITILLISFLLIIILKIALKNVLKRTFLPDEDRH